MVMKMKESRHEKKTGFGTITCVYDGESVAI